MRALEYESCQCLEKTTGGSLVAVLLVINKHHALTSFAIYCVIVYAMIAHKVFKCAPYFGLIFRSQALDLLVAQSTDGVQEFG